MTVRNPIEWTWAQFVELSHGVGAAGRSLHHIQDTFHSPAPSVQRIGVADVKDAIAKGLEDFGANRSDVIFLCAFYTVVGLILAQMIFNAELLPLLFPLASGFALFGPLVAVGLYEMSRRREKGLPVSWSHAFDVARSPAFAAIVILGLVLTAIFVLWLASAWWIYASTLGPQPPASAQQFVRDVFMTVDGRTMIAAGVGVGFLFAVLAMSVSVVSFPLLLDRDVGLDTAIGTSMRAVVRNPVPMAVWGLIVASALALGSIPFFLGLAVVIPVLGHATWHLYRKLVPR